jgi:hypothetical protein
MAAIARRMVIGGMMSLPLVWSGTAHGRLGDVRGPGAGMTEAGASWDGFLTLANEYLRAQQKRLKAEYGLGTWQRFDMDQTTGTLTFSTAGKAGVIADIQVVGSTSKLTDTWLWSWGNASILDAMKQDMATVRTYGETHGFDRLTTRKWGGDDADGWEMTAAAYILRPQGAYRAPDDKSAVFMIMRKVRRVS